MDGRCILRFRLTSVATPILMSGMFCRFSDTRLARTSALTLSSLIVLVRRGPGVAVRLDTRYSCHNGSTCGRHLSRQQTRSMMGCLVTRNITTSHLAPINCNRDRPGIIHHHLARHCPFLRRGSALARTFVLGLPRRRRRVYGTLGHQARFHILQAACKLFSAPIAPRRGRRTAGRRRWRPVDSSSKGALGSLRGTLLGGRKDSGRVF